MFRIAIRALLLVVMLNGDLPAQQPEPHADVPRQSLDDAWWTGPMLAPSAATLPPGHILIEPYLFDVISAHARSYGSLTYVNYGLVNRFTVGVIPIFGYNTISHGPSSSGVAPGDLTVQAQYRLTQFHEGGRVPTMSLSLQETFPTGQYDHLGTRPSNALGSGAYSTTVSIYSQTYFWMPNGRILRMRFNAGPTFSSHADVHGLSSYGTFEGFRGWAYPGDALLVDVSGEYSVTRNWVLALDAAYHYSSNTRVTGYYPGSTQLSRTNSGLSDGPIIAPAVEYNWTPKVGVLLGLRVIAGGRNTPSSFTPAVAINYVH